jgi:hypothetical protein
MSLEAIILEKPVASLTGTGSPVNSGSWHLPQLGESSSRVSGTLFLAKQCGQTTLMGCMVHVGDGVVHSGLG